MMQLEGFVLLVEFYSSDHIGSLPKTARRKTQDRAKSLHKEIMGHEWNRSSVRDGHHIPIIDMNMK